MTRAWGHQHTTAGSNHLNDLKFKARISFVYQVKLVALVRLFVVD